MTASSWIDPRVSQVTVPQVRAYMARYGWEELHSVRPEVLAFGGKIDDDGLAILFAIPAFERMPDYRQRVTELIGALGVYEDRYAGDVLSEMLRGELANGTVPAVVQQAGA